MKLVLEGNHAASYGALLARVEVVSAYPITPQTQIVEKLAEFCAEGRLKARFLEVESEHSAMAACIGASQAGVRTFTATSSQGLALMHELLHWAGAGRLPIVLVNVNRALAPPWSIYADQTDSLAQRDTGWIQIYCRSNQEVLDSVLLGYKVSEQLRLPSMLCLDAFLLSHTSEPVDVPDQTLVDAFLPPYRPEIRLDPATPHAFGGLAGPDIFMELRHATQAAMDEALALIVKAGQEFHDLTDRRYGLMDAYRVEGAKILLVTMGTIATTAETAVDQLREAGVAAGLVRLRVFRPFPAEMLARQVGGAKKLLVLDRNISLGGGGILASELRAALAARDLTPPIWTYIAGIGGRDVTPNDIVGAFQDADAEQTPGPGLRWLGLKTE
ncbi:MAG TPA: transketolase C-terminal domain-containing protein [Candidatus Methylomirabilis sp.]|nr:transketolase C-terminal domain-containing protein [Candidatus Methylomirabilis sp.]